MFAVKRLSIDDSGKLAETVDGGVYLTAVNHSIPVSRLPKDIRFPLALSCYRNTEHR